MKRILLLLVLSVLFIGCESPSTEYKVLSEEDAWDTIEIDGCEYIIGAVEDTYQGYGYLALKGNQSNPDCRCNCGGVEALDSVVVNGKVYYTIK